MVARLGPAVVLVALTMASALAVPVSAQEGEPESRPVGIVCVDQQTYASPATGAQTFSVVLGQVDWSPRRTANVTLNVTLRNEAYGPVVESFQRDYAVPLLEDPNTDPPPRWTHEFDLASPPGLYELTATLWPQGYNPTPGDLTWWGYGGGYLHVGPVPHHGHENIITGRCATRSLDLTGDGVADFTMDPAVGPANVTQWGVRSSSWRGMPGDHVEAWLSLFFTPPTRMATAQGSIDGDAVRAVLGVADLDHVSIQAGPAVETELVDGTFVVHLGPPTAYGYTGQETDTEVRLVATFPNPVPEPMRDLGFYDGRRLVLNLTQGDFDADGEPDLLMWATNGTDAAEAKATVEADRRGSPTRLNVRILIEETANATVLRLELIRYDGGHEGAWIEMRQPDRLFAGLFDGAEAARLAYALDLPPEEGFVQREGDTVWVWVSHFSTRTLTIVVPKVAGVDAETLLPRATWTSTDPQPPGDPHVDSPVPLALPLLALLVVVVAVRLRRRGR